MASEINSARLCLLMTAALVTANCLVAAKVHFEQPVPTQLVAAVVGGSADLPCDVNPASPEDRILLVLWYREGLETPVYSYDVRRHSVRDGRHWSDSAIVGSRSHFRLGSWEQTSRLTISDVRESDEGSYRCRVDFKLSPTRNSIVNLTVLVPPKTLRILDNAGVEMKSAVGPYTEGGPLILTCEAAGGRPPPRVTWWRHNRLVDATMETILQGKVTNTLRLYNLTRDDLGISLTCQAANNNMSVPVSATVAVDMKLRPLSVKLSKQYDALSADRKYEFVCTSSGARPSALITWWKGSTRLQSSKQTLSADGNTTTSVLTYVPLLDDDGKYLTCRAEHELLLEHNLEESWRLTIHYVPIAQLEFGGSISVDNLKEGDDVYFDCNVRASPWITRIIWRHNGKQIHPNTTQGIVVHNQTLIVRHVDRRWSGLFTCVASNEEGDGESNALPLHIRFLPVCKEGQSTRYYAARGETLSIPCEVEAYPTDLIFHWTFNGSRDFVDIPGSHFVADRLKSSLTYTPLTEQDYGTIMCWSRNVAGEQQTPCISQILPAGRPDPVANCSQTNQTGDSLHIQCLSGYDGGLPQHFLVETSEELTGRIVSNRTSHVTGFTVRGLEAGRSYLLKIWAVNQKGRSDPVVVQAATLRPPEKEKRTEPVVASNAVAPASSPAPTAVPVQLTPVLGTLIGVGSALILVAVIIVVVMRVRSQAHRGRSRQDGFDKAAVPLNVEADDSFDVKDGPTGKGPSALDTRDEDEKAFDRILSMSTSRKLLTSPKAAASRATSTMYAELSLPPNGGDSLHAVTKSNEPTVYAQIDHGKRGPTSVGVSTLAPPTSGYIRLPPVDQYHLAPYEDNSPAASPSVSQPTGPGQQVFPAGWMESDSDPQDSCAGEMAERISPLGTTRL